MNLDELRSELHYDPENGKFTWKKEAGTVTGHGYRYIRVNQKMMLAHRMAWLMYYGVEPEGLVDHINGNRLDNRIANLRLADYSQNGANARRHMRNRSGYKGVSRVLKNGKWTGRWQASITVRNKQMNLGYFDTKDEAHEAYMAAAKLYHGVFANSGLSNAIAPASLVSRDWMLVATPRFGA